MSRLPRPLAALAKRTVIKYPTHTVPLKQITDKLPAVHAYELLNSLAEQVKGPTPWR